MGPESGRNAAPFSGVGFRQNVSAASLISGRTPRLSSTASCSSTTTRAVPDTRTTFVAWVGCRARYRIATIAPNDAPRTNGFSIPSTSQTRITSSAHWSRFHSLESRRSLRRWSTNTTCMSSASGRRSGLKEEWSWPGPPWSNTRVGYFFNRSPSGRCEQPSTSTNNRTPGSI